MLAGGWGFTVTAIPGSAGFTPSCAVLVESEHLGGPVMSAELG